MQALLQVVYVEVLVAVERYEVVLVALVVAHEDVLAVHRAVVAPPSLSLLYGLSFRMIVTCEWYAVFSQKTEYCLFSCHTLSVRF